MIRRDSLRAQTDFFSPMTGNTGIEIRYAAAPTPISGKYSSEVKSRLADIGSGGGRRAELIKARKTAMNKTDDPYSQSAVKSAADAFDKEYGVLQGDIESIKDQVATTVESQVDKVAEDLNLPPQVTVNTPEKAVEIATKVKEAAVAEPEKKSRSAYMGNSKYQSPRRVANRNKAKAMAKARKAKKSSTSGQGFGSRSTVGSKRAARGARGSTSSRSRGGTSRGGSKSTSGSKKGARGARGSAGSRGRGGTSRGGKKGTRGRGGRRGGSKRCDIRCKVNISLLTNMNLLRDDLADVAYFVKELQESN